MFTRTRTSRCDISDKEVVTAGKREASFLSAKVNTASLSDSLVSYDAGKDDYTHH